VPSGRRRRRRWYRFDAADDAAADDARSTWSETEAAFVAAVADDRRLATGPATSTFDRQRAYATPADSAPVAAAAADVDDVVAEDVSTDRLRVLASLLCHD